MLEKQGFFSASSAHKLVTVAGKPELPKGGITYAEEKAEEELTEGFIDGYKSQAMNDGSDQEPESMDHFMMLTGLTVTDHNDDQKFIKLGKNFGCTPDGIIDPDGGVEGKCPIAKTHMKYLRTIKNQQDLKKEMPAYYWQCQTSMLVTGAKYWYWFSYNKRFKNPKHRMLYIKIERNEEDLKFFKDRLRQAVAIKNSIIKELNG
jgi:hypothetical protein